MQGNNVSSPVLTMWFLLFAFLPVIAVADPCDPGNIPEPLRNAIHNGFPSWRIDTTKDLEDPYHQKLWLESDPKECPGIAKGHYVSKAYMSYAVLLVPVDSKDLRYKLLVSRNASDAVPRLEVLLSGTVITRRQVIYTASPGKYVEFYGGKSVRLYLDGLAFETMEASVTLFYFRGGSFRRLLVSD